MRRKVLSGVCRDPRPQTTDSDPAENVGLFNPLHYPVLRETSSMLGVLHRITSHCHVPDEVKTERTSTVLVACEFG